MPGVLAGKRAVVTGGSRGIGEATVLELARQGADVALLVNVSVEQGEEVARAAREFGVESFATQCDVSNPDAVTAAFEQVRERFGSLEVCVNNAGIVHNAAAGAADAVSLKLVKHAGLLGLKRVAAVAEAAGIGLYGGCLLESSVGAAAHLQVFATLRDLAWGCEHFGPQILVGDLVTEPLRFADFDLHLPTGPGLGVTLDPDRMRAYARS